MLCNSCGYSVPEECDGVIKTRIDPFRLEIYEESIEIQVCDNQYGLIAEEI